MREKWRERIMSNQWMFSNDADLKAAQDMMNKFATAANAVEEQ
jgi:hypothetical protein